MTLLTIVSLSDRALGVLCVLGAFALIGFILLYKNTSTKADTNKRKRLEVGTEADMIAHMHEYSHAHNLPSENQKSTEEWLIANYEKIRLSYCVQRNKIRIVTNVQELITKAAQTYVAKK
jgi:hypothetical protein